MFRTIRSFYVYKQKDTDVERWIKDYSLKFQGTWKAEEVRVDCRWWWWGNWITVSKGLPLWEDHIWELGLGYWSGLSMKNMHAWVMWFLCLLLLQNTRCGWPTSEKKGEGWSFTSRCSVEVNWDYILDSSSEAREKPTEANLKNLGALWMSMGPWIGGQGQC